MKFRPVGAEDRHKEVNNRVSKFCECAYETRNELVVTCSTIQLFSDVFQLLTFRAN
jgi:hypothetical protein